jgi:hypothetical protein
MGRVAHRTKRNETSFMPLSDDQNKEFIAYLDSMDKSLYELLANIRFIKRILISVLLIPAIFSSLIALFWFINN